MSNNRVIIFDTTLRDGEQSPGASMNKEEKIRIAKILEEMRVEATSTAVLMPLNRPSVAVFTPSFRPARCI